MIVMQSIKNVSRNGRTVMVTIHQPSIDIFETFDALVLLRRGGTVSARLSLHIVAEYAQAMAPWVRHSRVSLTVQNLVAVHTCPK